MPDAVRDGSEKPPTYYRVKRGDTLFSIARLFNTTVDKIKSWNRLRGNSISAGTRLMVEGITRASQPPTANSPDRGGCLFPPSWSRARQQIPRYPG